MKPITTVDLTKLGAAIQSAPAEIVHVSERAVATNRRNMPYLDRLTALGDKAMQDIEELMEYEITPEGKQVSKISEGTRQRYNLYLLEKHPEQQKNQNAVLVVQLGDKDLNTAQRTAMEMDRRKAIETTAEVIEP